MLRLCNNLQNVKFHHFVTNTFHDAFRCQNTLAIAILACVLTTTASLLGQTTTPPPTPRAGLQSQQTVNKVFRDRVQPHWMPDGSTFWYAVKTGPDSREYVLVDAKAATRKPAFDHARLAAALQSAGVANASSNRLALDKLEYSENTLNFTSQTKRWTCNLANYELREREAVPADPLPPLSLADAPRTSLRTGEETQLTFVNHSGVPVELFWLDAEGARRSYGKLPPNAQRVQHTFAGHVWMAIDDKGKTLLVCEANESTDAIEITSTPTGRFQTRERRRPNGPQSGVSPDGAWRAFIKDNNLWIRNLSNSVETALSDNGSESDGYSREVFWSPNSKKLAAMRVKKGDQRKVTLIESSPKDQTQPRVRTIDYPKPGDAIPIEKPHLFDIATAREIPVSDTLFSNPWSNENLRWEPDSTRFTFVYNQRGHQVLRIIAIDAASGAARAIIDERSDTFIDYSGKQFTEYLDKTGEIIWMSERDGWNHLYLYDARAGAVKNQITKGEWVVREVDRVDPEKRQIWFRAGGIRPGQNPYYIHNCRVNFDGSGLVVMTEGDGSHAIDYSPNGEHIIDTYSRVDMPPVTELRRVKDGSLVCELERADWTALLATGWRAPERFVAKGRDGQTDIYGVIFAPSALDPAKQYPVIENIYAGPQDSYAPKHFSAFHSSQELAELGFIVVQIDGMGTANRSKKFHDVCWKNLVDAGLPDRILWMKAAAATRPWMNLEKVGVYGTSAGGQNALGALLTHGDFYKAGVADCGCHDNRMDKIWWNEQWMGWPIGPHYAEQSNVTLAKNLRGKLLLMVGELDTNVDPSSTMQVVNALITADKNFDLIVFPGVGHGALGTPYGKRRMQEFFLNALTQ
jgi:dipeptidyl aminopeptidase/acylaminoacyl peptidase